MRGLLGARESNWGPCMGYAAQQRNFELVLPKDRIEMNSYSSLEATECPHALEADEIVLVRPVHDGSSP